MSTSELLNEKLSEFSEWIDNLSKLEQNDIKSHRDELRTKGRNANKFRAEVQLLNDDQLIDKFSKMMSQFRNLTAIANGRKPKTQPKLNEPSVSQVNHS